MGSGDRGPQHPGFTAWLIGSWESRGPRGPEGAGLGLRPHRQAPRSAAGVRRLHQQNHRPVVGSRDARESRRPRWDPARPREAGRWARGWPSLSSPGGLPPVRAPSQRSGARGGAGGRQAAGSAEWGRAGAPQTLARAHPDGPRTHPRSRGGPGARALPHAPREHGDSPAPPTPPLADTLTRGHKETRGARTWGAAEPHRGPFIRFRRRKTFSARPPRAPAPRRWPAGRR